MKSDQLISTMVNDIISTVNRYQLPLSVKALALENVLMRVQLAIQENTGADESATVESTNTDTDKESGDQSAEQPVPAESKDVRPVQ